MPVGTSADPLRALKAARAISLRTNAAFLAHKDEDGNLITLCNCAVNAMTAELGCPVPVLIANEQHDWLDGPAGADAGWYKLEDDSDGTAIEKARLLAEAGGVVVASWKNGSGGHGHIGLCVPAPDTDKGTLYVAAAGVQNFEQAPLTRSFGLSIHPDFYAHRD
jgi:hypothetical protein